jgi:hypothetical protein
VKKLLVKIKVIDIPYSPLIPAEPEKWVKGDEVKLEQPMVEVSPGVFEPDSEYTHHEGIPEVPEQLEVSHEDIIAQTQGEEAELQIWLDGDKHKYPEGHWVEWIDITEEVNKQKAIDAKIALGQKARLTCDKVLDLISGYNLDRELSAEQITSMQSSFAPIELALRSGRPSLAKYHIANVVVDGVLVSQEMKDLALELLADY